MRWNKEQYAEYLRRQVRNRGRNQAVRPIPDAQLEPDAQHEQVGEGCRKAPDRSRYRVGFDCHVCRLLDVDNLCGSVKWACDILRAANLIPEDNPAAIDLEVRQTKVATRAEECTLITIER